MRSDLANASHAIGGGIGAGALTSVGAAILAVAAILLLCLPRRYAVAPFLLGALLLPLGQQVYAAGVHWLPIRLLVLVALPRVLASLKRLKASWTTMDTLLISYSLVQVIAVMSLYANRDAVVNQLGAVIDAIGSYLVLRTLINDRRDVRLSIACLAIATVLIGAGMVREQLTGQNIFGAIGGTRLVSEIREGRIRSQGAFQHSLTAGAFGATLLPLFILQWRNERRYVMAIAGLLGCTAMTVCSNSSTPLLAYAGALLSIGVWPMRNRMRTIRWTIVGTLVGVACVMKAPVWFVIAHIDLTGGSSGYHRAELIDQFLRHFADWWAIGVKEAVAGTWMYDMWDQQNQFVNVGETGGLLALILFVALISVAFAKVGACRRAAREVQNEAYIWFVGCALFAHCVAFFGVNYFDQARIGWLVLVAFIAASDRKEVKTLLVTSEQRQHNVSPRNVALAYRAQSLPNSARRAALVRK